MSIEDAKEELAELFFQCARYERPCTDWGAALDKFTKQVETTEREACVKMLRDQVSHVRDNANALREFQFVDDEARCRELAASYLTEVAWLMESALTSEFTGRAAPVE